MAARDNREIDDTPVFRIIGGGATERVLPVNNTDLTDDQFVRGVALALRAQWEGEDYFGAATDSLAPDQSEAEPHSEWAEYRTESVAAILAFLDMLHHRGFRIVRKAN